MAITAAEQLLIELINRARLDPAGEAARAGIALDAGLPAGLLTAEARQPLAGNPHLAAAAAGHAAWMLAADVFSHTGSGGSTPAQRMAAAGYALAGSWTAGENIAWSGTTGSVDPVAAILQHHRGLFESPGHRLNILDGAFREIGVGQELGPFSTGGRAWNASMLAEKFAASGGAAFVTGVVIADRDGDRFYDPGEGLAGARVAAAGAATATAAAGGYALAVARGGPVAVTVTLDGTARTVALDLSAGNVKLDMTARGVLLVSGDATLKGGAADAALLGAGDLRLTGNAAANRLEGNAGANRLAGAGGNDVLAGGAGNDTLEGGPGHDTLEGGAGHDRLSGGTGDDRIEGGPGDDVLAGGAGADTFVFAPGHGRDRILGFDPAGGDMLAVAAALAPGAADGAAVAALYASATGGGLRLVFATGDTIDLPGAADLSALAEAILLA